MENKNIQTTVAPNWENQPESFLAEIKLGEIVPDFSPEMLELSGK